MNTATDLLLGLGALALQLVALVAIVEAVWFVVAKLLGKEY